MENLCNKCKHSPPSWDCTCSASVIRNGHTVMDCSNFKAISDEHGQLELPLKYKLDSDPLEYSDEDKKKELLGLITSSKPKNVSADDWRDMTNKAIADLGNIESIGIVHLCSTCKYFYPDVVTREPTVEECLHFEDTGELPDWYWEEASKLFTSKELKDRQDKFGCIEKDMEQENVDKDEGREEKIKEETPYCHKLDYDGSIPGNKDKVGNVTSCVKYLFGVHY